ncbi:hypothetical protein ABZ826_22445 [Streptomyces sp. NPDC047515]|uniref:hypothetical protein n=1 Tax=Streptomyces sp. NPDC047515 TaxID=3155380 RepID=UPI0033CA7DA1
MTLSVSSSVATHEGEDPKSLITKNRTIVLESAANMAKRYGCADPQSNDAA